MIGSRKKASKLERDVLLFSRPFCREESHRRAEWAGLPGLIGRGSVRRRIIIIIIITF